MLLGTDTAPETFKCHKPWDGTEVPGSFGLILAREPHLQQLLGPLEEMCTVIFHHETTDTQQKILNVGCNVYSLINPSSISYNLLRYSPLSNPGVDFLKLPSSLFQRIPLASAS